MDPYSALLKPLVQAKKKLVTKEDPIHLHKTLGILSLVSFFYRYRIVYCANGNLGLENDLLSWLTMAVHLGLPASSLIFIVVKHRLSKFPMVIYEEYRLHAILFTSRCCAVFAFGLVRPYAGTYLERVMLFVTVLTWHLLTDEVTRRYGMPGNTAVRVKHESSDSQSGSENKFARLAIRTGQRFYAFYQMSAVCAHLLPSVRSSDLGYNTLVAIQSSAFLMTLYRKGLINWYSHAIWYTSALVLSLYHMYHIFPDPWLWARVFTVFLLRINGMPKYPLYIAFALVCEPLLAMDTWDYQVVTDFNKNIADFSLPQTSFQVPDLANMKNASLVQSAALCLVVWGMWQMRQSSLHSPPSDDDANGKQTADKQS